mmetsp:Transcript_11508/g.30083  ORF Transcript_11508/g.30083 Transcript_11508/m.30083 type:complete len:233 (+) Transcript_11508:309-1007(+)
MAAACGAACSAPGTACARSGAAACCSGGACAFAAADACTAQGKGAQEGVREVCVVCVVWAWAPGCAVGEGARSSRLEMVERAAVGAAASPDATVWDAGGGGAGGRARAGFWLRDAPGGSGGAPGEAARRPLLLAGPMRRLTWRSYASPALGGTLTLPADELVLLACDPALLRLIGPGPGLRARTPSAATGPSAQAAPCAAAPPPSCGRPTPTAPLTPPPCAPRMVWGASLSS